MIIPQANEIHILYVDNENHNLNSFKATFRRSYNVFTANSFEEAEVTCKNNNIHVIIIDLYTLNQAEIELLSFVIKYSHLTRILLTSFADENYLETAMSNGYIYQYFQKPWNEIKLRNAIEEGYLLYNAQLENRIS